MTWRAIAGRPYLGEKSTGRVSGRYEAGIPEAHRGAVTTSLCWSPDGDAFVCGDNRGVCSVVVLTGKFSGAHTIRFKAPIAQVSFLADGSAALVSTSEQLYLLYRQQAGSRSDARQQRALAASSITFEALA